MVHADLWTKEVSKTSAAAHYLLLDKVGRPIGSTIWQINREMEWLGGNRETLEIQGFGWEILTAEYR